jgi:hypothetical protein
MMATGCHGKPKKSLSLLCVVQAGMPKCQGLLMGILEVIRSLMPNPKQSPNFSQRAGSGDLLPLGEVLLIVSDYGFTHKTRQLWSADQ